MKHRIVILDRDGVLNAMTVDQESGTIDSPLHASQVVVFEWAAQAIALLVESGYRIFIATNQPAAAKGKTARKNLEEVHQCVLDRVSRLGGLIEQSFICWDSSDSPRRKPRPGMLFEAIAVAGEVDFADSWMVGDGVIDIEAGRAAGLRTAFIGAHKCSTCGVFLNKGFMPDMFCENLHVFASNVTRSKE